MKELIESKMRRHVLSITDKPIISNEEYYLLAGYLSKLEMEQMRAEEAKNHAALSERLMDCLGISLGGVKE